MKLSNRGAVRYSETHDLPAEGILAVYRANDLVVSPENQPLAQGFIGVSLTG
jgi:hypothetical protein